MDSKGKRNSYIDSQDREPTGGQESGSAIRKFYPFLSVFYLLEAGSPKSEDSGIEDHDIRIILILALSPLAPSETQKQKCWLSFTPTALSLM